MVEITHRSIETNGLNMHLAEAGEGPLVVLCHGFPETWYCWRHQLPALARAGFQAVAPDQRGYGRTECPEPIDAYDYTQLVGDLVGLVQALGHETAIIVGHDFGAHVAAHCALLRPDMFRGLVLLSVPYRPRTWGRLRPTELMARMTGEKVFYQSYFQEPGRAEKILEADVRQSLAMLLYTLSGDRPHEQRWRFVFDKSESILDTLARPETLPPWLTEQDLDLVSAEFERTGFRGGLNWYRNLDREWELTSFLTGARIHQPCLFAAGELDDVIAMMRPAYDTLEESIPNLVKKVLLPGVGHWIQQERPGELNELLLDFLKSL